MIREFDLTNELRWQACKKYVDMNWEAFKGGDNQLRVIVTTATEKRRDRQNKYYFGGVIQQIADQAMVNGQKFSKKVWHTYYAEMFAPLEQMVLPDGTTRTQRKSTADMVVKEFAEYTEEVIASAASELGVIFYLPEE